MRIVLRLMKQRSVRKSSRLQSLPEPICLTIVSLPSEAYGVGRQCRRVRPWERPAI
jgi:hypothetical protein